MGVDPLNPGGWGACAVKLQPFKGHEILSFGQIDTLLRTKAGV